MPTTAELIEKIGQGAEAMRAEAEAAKKLSEETSAAFKEFQTRNYAEFKEFKEQLTKLTANPGPGRSIPVVGADGASTEPEVKGQLKGAPYFPDKRTTQQKQIHRQGFVNFARSGKSGLGPEDLKALGEVPDAGGGFYVPPDWSNEMVAVAPQIAEIRTVANVRSTARDRVMINKMSALPTVYWGQDAASVPQSDPGTAFLELPIYDQFTLTLVSQDELEDTEIDLWAFLQEQFSEQFYADEDGQFSDGTGVQRPQGFFTSPVLQSTRSTLTGTGGAMKGDDLINTYFALKKTYRRKATWALSSTIEAYVRTLKDANGQYLWQVNPFTSVADGSPTTILGRPVINTEGHPDLVATGKYPVCVADFSRGYWIRDRRELTLQRLVEKYSDTNQVGFKLKRRVGGMPVLAEAFALTKIA